MSNTAPLPPSARPETTEPEASAALAAEFGLSAEEYDLACSIMGREMSLTELGIFSVMWSEHCSYKSSRVWLAKLPTKAPWVIQGPGENAGVIDIGDGLAAIFKMESHNHPSFIEPYQGAATGVGGILRDVFTMGARPVANMNALRFGTPDHPKTRHLLSGVVAGIGGYGNCVGVPTVGGEVNFHPAYNGNILVNAMTVGIAPADRIFYSKAAGIGNPVVYVGSKTGRDGIHGATMASAEFDDASEEKRPTVQVGDPFTEKLLIEACLELMASDAIVAIQDMGAAGLTSSSVEMADKGGVGIRLDLDLVPLRSATMSAYEIMLSESQERMLMVLKPGREDFARAVFEKWGLDFAVIGEVTDTGRLQLSRFGRVVADMPVRPLVDQAPKYERAFVETPAPAPLDAGDVPLKSDVGETLLKLLATPDLASRRWIYEQYDSLVRGRTAAGPGQAEAGAAACALVQVNDAGKALAITTDCTPRYCLADPETGGAQAVAEAWRNITATGATPLAITDNMNFGNPEKPEIMGQFAGCITGMARACAALDFPVVSGNVSLYNETSGKAILPTPAIGGVGVIADVAKAARTGLAPGLACVLIGETAGALGQSLYAREIHAREDGAPPLVDLAAERLNGDFVRARILAGDISACQDLSDGGLAVALAEMAMSGDCGAVVDAPDGRHDAGFWFGEDQARYLVTTRDADALLAMAADAAVPAVKIGETGGDHLRFGTESSIYVSELRDAHEGWMPGWMDASH